MAEQWSRPGPCSFVAPGRLKHHRNRETHALEDQYKSTIAEVASLQRTRDTATLVCRKYNSQSLGSFVEGEFSLAYLGTKRAPERVSPS